MSRDSKMVLGVEGGGTKTDWVLLRGSKVVKTGHLPPANFRLVTEDQLLEMFRLLPADISDAGIFLAGCVTEADRQKLKGLAAQVWPQAHLVVGSDRESGFAAAFGNGDGIAVMSGTGSAVTGRKNGRIENAGGRGHLLGDRGGGYMICMEGLRLALRTYDLEHRITDLAKNILRGLMLNRMEDLIAWTQGADKMGISGLSPVMFAAAENGDQEMMKIMEAGALSLAEYTQSVARWLQFENPPVKLLGGLFLHQPLYVKVYKEAIQKLLETSSIELCTTSGAFGAARLATSIQQTPKVEKSMDFGKMTELERATTEQNNPRSGSIDQMKTAELIDLFIAEQEFIGQALVSEKENILKGVELVVHVFRNNGRLFYVGAGTSGRLGVLDASEIPPTFGEPPERVQAIIAGGVTALYQSVEGAEDDELSGAMAVIQRGVTSNDAVCGISASGRTPFVLSALIQAKLLEAKTILLTCNPERNHSAHFDLEIDLPVGPELITGSTRLKGGSATKLVLNILTTCSMIRLGRVRGNLMSHVKPSNTKLRGRAIRIVSRLRNVSLQEAEQLLEQSNWNLIAVLEQQ
jgi:N-acetylmuramic acid 6-phosphate etherase